MARASERRKDASAKGTRAARETASWQALFRSALEQDDVQTAISILDTQKTPHAGTPRQAVKIQAAKLIGSQYNESLEALYSAAVALARSTSEGAQETGLILLAPLYARNPPEVTAILLNLADSANWEVREWAASALRTVIRDEFTAVFPTLREWAGHTSPNLRRVVAVASGSASRDCTQAECRLLLEILTPLLEDDAPYVRKNLSAFAIGDSFLKSQPELVAAWLGRASVHPRAQWNVAMALSSAEAARHFDLLSELLWQLAADDRAVVRRATCKAVLNLAKRIPEEIVPLLEKWKKDARRSHVYASVRPRL